MHKFGCLAGLILLTLPAFALDEAAYTAAVELYSQRKSTEAEQAFDRLAQADPANADIQYYLGRLALQRNDYEKAVTCLELAVHLRPGDLRYHLRLGDAYGLTAQKAGLLSKLGWARKCEATYRHVVELDGSNIEARSRLLAYYLQAPALAGGGNDKALGQAQAIKQLDDTRGRLAVASVYAADKKYDLAFAEFAELLSANPTDYFALYQTGRLAATSGQQLDRGLVALRQCLVEDQAKDRPGPAAEVHWLIGRLLEQKGDKSGARTAYEAALASDPQYRRAIEALAKL